SAIPLAMSPGIANAAAGEYQGGQLGRATLWRGTPTSAVNLHPSGYDGSSILAMAGDVQAGYGFVNNQPHAGYWRGTAASFVDLHPTWARDSMARATDGVNFGGYVALGTPTFETQAALWVGGSYINLTPPGVGFAQIR